MEVIEGFYMRARDVIFYAKGVEHPPGKIVALPKYVLSSDGERVAGGRRFRKLLTLKEQMAYVTTHYGEYVVEDKYIGSLVPEIPLSMFEEIYDPIERAEDLLSREDLRGAEKDAADMLRDLRSVSRAIGVSGSILVGLHTAESDVDLIVYGEEDGRRVYELLRKRIEEGEEYRRYSERDATSLYSRRSEETPLSWEEFTKQERVRVLEGFYRGREYSIRLVKPPEEPYGSKIIRKLERATLITEVVDDRESIFTPCRYGVRVLEVLGGPEYGVNVGAVYSLRERFTEVARMGDVIEAKGQIELWNRVKTGREELVLYLGGEGDYMKVVEEMERD